MTTEPSAVPSRATMVATIYVLVDDWLGRFVGHMAYDRESRTYYWRMRVGEPGAFRAYDVRQLDGVLEEHNYWFEDQPSGSYVCRAIDCDMLRAFVIWQRGLTPQQREEIDQGSVEACLYTFLGSNTSETAVKTKSSPFK